MENRKLINIFLVFLMILTVGLSIFSFVHADDDEEDDHEDKNLTTASPASLSKQETKTVTQTVIVSPSRTVTENQIRMVTLPDGDRDGIADDEDPHPEIPEIYIVKDDNLNGIVDTFEYGN